MNRILKLFYNELHTNEPSVSNGFFLANLTHLSLRKRTFIFIHHTVYQQQTLSESGMSFLFTQNLSGDYKLMSVYKKYTTAIALLVRPAALLSLMCRRNIEKGKKRACKNSNRVHVKESGKSPSKLLCMPYENEIVCVYV